jgi:hypothetical protein
MYQVNFPAQSRDASWAFIGQITDLDNNPIDLTGLTLVFTICDKRGCVRLSASTNDGSITILDVGVFRWFFTLQQMQTLRNETYQTGMTAKTADGTQTVQFFVGPLPVITGNMTGFTSGGFYDGGFYPP